MALLLFVISARGQESVLEKKISLSVNEISLTDMFRELHDKEGINFAIMNHIVPGNYKVNLSVTNRKLKEVLDLVLKGTKLEYKEINNEIVIYKPKHIVDTPKKETNIINVINIYDTIYSVNYDTITNVVFDTMLIVERDTLVYLDTIVNFIDRYKSLYFKQFSIGLSYQPQIYSSNSQIQFNEPLNNHFSSETLISSNQVNAHIDFKLNRFAISTGAGINQLFTINEYKSLHYQYQYKDTTHLTEVESYDYRIEGDSLIILPNSKWVDTTYTLLNDSVQYEQSAYTKTRINYLTIPFSFGFQAIRTEKSLLYINLGGTVEILLGDTELNVPDNFKPRQYSPTRINYFASVNWEYKLSRKVSINTMIIYRSYLTSKYVDINIPKNNHQISLGLGLNYIFGKE